MDSSTVIITLPDKTKKTYMLSNGEWVESPSIESFFSFDPQEPFYCTMPCLDALTIALSGGRDPIVGIEAMAKYNERTGFMECSDSVIGYGYDSFIMEKYGIGGDVVGYVPQIGEMYLIALPDIGEESYLNNPQYFYPIAPKTYICKVFACGVDNCCLVNYDCSLETAEEYEEFLKFIRADFTGETDVVEKEIYQSVQFFLPFRKGPIYSTGNLEYLYGFVTREKRLKSMSMIMIRIK